MIRAYDDYGNVVDMVEYENRIKKRVFDCICVDIDARMRFLEFLAEREQKKQNEFQEHYYRGVLRELKSIHDELEDARKLLESRLEEKKNG